MCNLSALSALRGPQSVSNDMGQYPVPEEPGLVPDPVIVWEGDNRAILEESRMPPKSATVLTCKCFVSILKIDEHKTYWGAAASNRGRAIYIAAVQSLGDDNYKINKKKRCLPVFKVYLLQCHNCTPTQLNVCDG